MHMVVVYSQSSNSSAPSVYSSIQCQGDCNSDTLAPSPQSGPTLSDRGTETTSPTLVPTPGESTTTVAPSPTPVPTFGDQNIVTPSPTKVPTLGDTQVTPLPTPIATPGDSNNAARQSILDSTLGELGIQLTIVGNGTWLYFNLYHNDDSSHSSPISMVQRWITIFIISTWPLSRRL